MSVEYEAFVGRGFMFGEDNVPSFKEYCERVKIDPNEAFEILQENDLVISDCYGYDWLAIASLVLTLIHHLIIIVLIILKLT